MIVPEGIGLGNFIAGRLPSRAVLDELRPYLAGVDRGTTPAARAFVVLDAAVTAHAQALDHLDRAERRLNAARTAVGASEARDGHRRRDRDGSAPGGPEQLPRRYDARASDRFSPRGLGSRRRAFAVLQACERRLRDRVGKATDYLHAPPAMMIGDLALKLAATIAAGEAGPPEATSFPWSRLRRVLADVARQAEIEARQFPRASGRGERRGERDI